MLLKNLGNIRASVRNVNSEHITQDAEQDLLKFQVCTLSD
jgi:hypothetical protein